MILFNYSFWLDFAFRQYEFDRWSDKLKEFECLSKEIEFQNQSVSEFINLLCVKLISKNCNLENGNDE